MQHLIFVALGDSLTVGYRSPSHDSPFPTPSPYTVFLKQKIDYFLGTHSVKTLDIQIHNKGVCGDLTDAMLSRFKRDVLDLAPDFVIILGGSNDIGWNLPVSKIFNNLKKLYEESRRNRIEPIACTLPSVMGFDIYLKPIIELNEFIRKYCKDHNILYGDIFSATSDKITNRLLKEYSNDGLHLTAKGYEKMADAIFNDAIKKILFTSWR